VGWMAAREPAHPIEKRDLLHAEKPNRYRILGIVAKLSSEGRWPEAIDYLEIAPNADGLAKAETDAVTRGSTWLLQQVERISGKKATPEKWMRLADAAQKNERWRDAVRALSLAGDSATAEALRVQMCPEYEPFKPLGK